MWDEFPEVVGSTVDLAYRRARDTGALVTVDEYYAPLDTTFKVHVFPEGLGVAVFMRDVDEDRRLRKQQREHAELTRAILDSLPAHNVVVDPDGTITSANQPWETFGTQEGGDPARWGVRDGLRVFLSHQRTLLQRAGGAAHWPVGRDHQSHGGHRPERGVLSPGAFITLAEETGLIVPISRWLLGEALRQVAAWSRDRAELTVAVNIAAQHLSVGTLVDDVTEALGLAGVRPQQLIVELTESNVAQTGSPGAPQRVAPSDWQSAVARPHDALNSRHVRRLRMLAGPCHHRPHVRSQPADWRARAVRDLSHRPPA